MVDDLEAFFAEVRRNGQLLIIRQGEPIPEGIETAISARIVACSHLLDLLVDDCDGWLDHQIEIFAG